MTKSFATPVVRLVTGCSCALLLAVSGGALAHGGHNNRNNGSNQDNHRSMHSSSHGGDWGGDHGWHHKHHHYHHKSANNGPYGLGPVHGQGSSHNPVVTHPPKVPKPIVTVGPVKPPSEPVVRDHRNGSSNGGRPYDRSCLTLVGGSLNGACIKGTNHHHRPPPHNRHCNKHNTSGCEVRDHRTPPPTQCYGDLC